MKEPEAEEKLLSFSTSHELLQNFEDFKRDTCTGWRCVGKETTFGKSFRLMNIS